MPKDNEGFPDSAPSMRGRPDGNERGLPLVETDQIVVHGAKALPVDGLVGAEGLRVPPRLVEPIQPGALCTGPRPLREFLAFLREDTDRVIGKVDRVVVGGDDRVVVGGGEETSALGSPPGAPMVGAQLDPFRSICALSIRYVGLAEPGSATGFLVGPNAVVTAAHALRARGGLKASSVTITPGRHGSSEPFGEMVSDRYSVPNEWLGSWSPDFDMAVIHLDEPARAAAGTLELAFVPDDELRAALVTVAGFPADDPAKGYDGRTMYAHALLPSRITPERIYYEIDTSPGQSGSPAWIVKEGRPVVVGVHTYAEDENFATRLRLDLLDYIKDRLEA